MYSNPVCSLVDGKLPSWGPFLSDPRAYPTTCTRSHTSCLCDPCLAPTCGPLPLRSLGLVEGKLLHAKLGDAVESVERLSSGKHGQSERSGSDRPIGGGADLRNLGLA